MPVRVERPALVVIVPGLGASDLSMRPLGTYLEAAGHLVFDSTLGLNIGSVEDDIERVTERVLDVAEIVANSLPDKA